MIWPIILLAGYSGVGKSTAVQVLERRKLAVGYYVGSVLEAELALRELNGNPQNERLVREELRTDHGMAVFAERSIATLKALQGSSPVVVDALYCMEELEVYQDTFGKSVVTLGISSDLSVRTVRVSQRNKRKIGAQELLERDQFERIRLGLDRVLEATVHTISNGGSLAEFDEAIQRFAVAPLGG